MNKTEHVRNTKSICSRWEILLCLPLFFLALFLLPAPANGVPLEAPNLTLNVYQRIFPASKEAGVTLSTYNLHQVTFTLYPVDIETLIPNTTVLNAGNAPDNPLSVTARLKKMSLAQPLKSWAVTVKHAYPNDWVNRQVKLPALPRGVYAIEASGGGVRQRTWLAISSRVLVTKRSPDALTAWLVSAEACRPIAGVTLALYGESGRLQQVKTGSDGLAVFKAPLPAGALWVSARDGEPAFTSAQPPEAEKPYRVYLYTDRPLYRPGQVVQFHGTVRAMQRGVYSLPTEKTVTIQIKTRGDVLVAQQQLPLNAWGSFSGSFTLAAEPPLGPYMLEVALPGDFREYAGFAVEAYRKPSFTAAVTMHATHLLGGQTVPVKISAHYIFGSPVSGGKVEYAVSFAPVSNGVPNEIRNAAGLGSAGIGDIEENVVGKGQLDGNGELILQLPTRVISMDRVMTVQTRVTDLSLQASMASADILLTGALFTLQANTNRDQYQPGNSVPVTVKARDYDDKPLSATVTVILEETRQDRDQHTIVERTTRLLHLDARGEGVVSFSVPRPGAYTVEVYALDSARNPVYAMTEFQVSAEKPAPAYPLLEITLAKDSYAPGETAQVHIRTSLTGSWALLTLEGERLYICKPIKLAQREFTLDLPVDAAYRPGVNVRLSTIQNEQLYIAYGALNVPMVGKQLQVTLTPEKTSYQPGERATYTVTTNDAGGHGVPAEVSLAVVDTALYALRPDATPAPGVVFWSPQPDRIETEYSLAAIYPGGAYQVIPKESPPPKGKPGETGDLRVRKRFEDTAFWDASLLTDATGHGTVAFTLPDNLTTWRTTARGMTLATEVGEARNEMTVSTPLIVQLVLPRFYITGDHATAAALLHNYTGAAREVHVTLSGDGIQIEGDAERTITVPAGGLLRTTWQVVANGQTGQAEDSARLQVRAEGGAGASDAMESTIPVHPDGVQRVDAAAGVSADGATFTMTLPAQALPASASLQLTLSPALAGPIFSALDYLVANPVGGTEQTMDRFLPDLIALRALRDLGVTRPQPPALQGDIDFGLQKLLRFQHDDGGWNWWEHDQSDPFMTAYVVYGLALARDAGYPRAAGPLPRGVAYLQTGLATTQQGDALAYFLRALTVADVWDNDSRARAAAIAAMLYNNRARLDLFSRASLALSLQRMSAWTKPPQDAGAMARTLAGELEAAGVTAGTGVSWSAHASGGGSWLDSNVEVTAQVLQALLAIKPDSARIVPAVRWLLAARDGEHWTSSKDTAAVVLALSAYLRQAKELTPDYTVTVSANAKDVGKYHMTAAQALAEPQKVEIPAALLTSGANTITLRQAGTGNLYWTAHLAYVLPVTEQPPLNKGIAIKREYTLSAENPVTAGDQPTGNLVQVTLHLTTEQPLRYAMLEEPIPAGCELLPGAEEANVCYDYADEFDNHLVYFFDNLPRGESSVSYWLCTAAPGVYHIPPSTGALLYFPEVRGESRAAQMKVVDTE